MKFSLLLMGAVLLLSQPVPADEQVYWDAASVKAVVDEAARLESEAAAQEKASAVRPVPARQLLFYLSLGLSRGGTPIDRPSDSDKTELTLGNVEDRAFRVTDGMCVVLWNQELQDKSGSYGIRHARLYQMKDDRWRMVGAGEIPVIDKP